MAGRIFLLMIQAQVLDVGIRRAGGVDYETLGVCLAASRGLGLAQYALHRHHGGLPSRDHIGRKMQEERPDGGGVACRRSRGRVVSLGLRP